MSKKELFIEIMDTTLRDGEQTQGVSYTPAEKSNIAKVILKSLKADRIEIASARISDGEKEAVKHVTQWAKTENLLEKVEVLGFVDHKLSVDWITEAGGKTINLLTKGSKKHCVQQLKRTLEEHIAAIKQTIQYALQQGLTVNVYLEDWSNGYRDNPEYVYEYMESLKDSGITRFMLPDTLGVMAPYEVYDSIHDMVTRFPWAHFDFHPHNDYGLATANVLFAVKAGARSVHCTMNCLGERAGNASLAEVVVVLRDKLKAQLSIDETTLTALSEMIENFSGKRIASNAPIVGEDVFTQTSGIHADGDKKANLYHNPITPERFGRQRTYALGKMSGKASLQKNLDQLGLQLSEENFDKVLRRIVSLGDSKKVITVADLPFIITDVLESSEQDRIQLLNSSITSGNNLKAIATIHLEMDGHSYLETGSGNGGYDAFMSAVKKVLSKEKIKCPELIDYEVRIPKGGKTDALTEATVTWKAEDLRFKTVGVDSDQVAAAVNATMKMLNMELMRQSSLNTLASNN
ncbi:MAG: 2-isopropylmalate synthase [SAR324 cluster bacterium]|nr:2-isopropylmalate synthase [SAR324 cluster bacterium]